MHSFRKHKIRTMENESQKKVALFLEGIRVLSEEKYQIIMDLRKMVSKINPDVKERMMYGGIMFSLADDDLGGIFAYSKHISFEFGLGYKFNDPDHLLLGKGKFRRHLKIESMNDRSFSMVDYYISQMFNGA